MKEVWVLGSENPKAHKNVEWKSPFPNFSNADVLVVNLQSLGQEELSNQTLVASLYEEARKHIFDMLMTGDKTVIVIMSSKPSELCWLPLYPIYKPTAPAKVGETPDLPLIKDYLKNVETCSYYFHAIKVDYFDVKTDPKSKICERYPFSSKARAGHAVKYAIEDEIQNVAKQTIGGFFRAVICYGNVWDGMRGIFTYEGRHVSGPVLFLPPPTKLNVERGIDLLLGSLIGAVAKDPIAPDWEKSIDVPGLTTYQGELRKTEDQIQSLNKRVDEITESITKLTRLRRLLWAEGEHLEMAVKDAFAILGFPEIRKVRAENLEDWVFDFKHIKEYEHGILEVKASEKRTSMADLTQCNKWAEDYLLEEKKAKGVFVANRFRLDAPEKSAKERRQFAPNELEYAKKREICILLTSELFDAVVSRLKTGQVPTRAQIEEKIAGASGLCFLGRE